MRQELDSDARCCDLWKYFERRSSWSVNILSFTKIDRWHVLFRSLLPVFSFSSSKEKFCAAISFSCNVTQTPLILRKLVVVKILHSLYQLPRSWNNQSLETYGEFTKEVLLLIYKWNSTRFPLFKGAKYNSTHILFHINETFTDSLW